MCDGRQTPWHWILLGALLVIAPGAPAQDLPLPETNLEMLLSLDPLPGDLGPLPEPPGAAPDTDLVHLGKVLFFDERVSPDGVTSCATCHLPERAWTDGLPTATGKDGQSLARNTPTILNTGFKKAFFWDGRAPTLEEQVRGPMLSELEHGFVDDKEVDGVLSRIPYYAKAFADQFDRAPTLKDASTAIAAFERSLTTPNARFDQFVQGNRDALTEQEKQGLGLFIGKAACTLCHQGPLLTDEKMHRLTGIKPGLDSGAILTPGLRNVALTAPFMHDGRFEDLAGVIAFYNDGGDGGAGQSPLVFPLGLSEAEQEALVSFLHTLTGELGVVASPVEAVRGDHGAHHHPPGPALAPGPAINFIPSPPEQFESFRELMSAGVHEQFSFLGFNMWHSGSLSDHTRKAIAASAENLAALADRSSELYMARKPDADDQAYFSRHIRELESICRSLAQAAQHGARAELESQFGRLEQSCNTCHTRFRPDLVWTGSHE